MPEPANATEPGLVRALEERAFNAWPALQTLVVGGWLLRFADGYTKRANSINAWAPTEPLDRVLAHAAPIYAARGLPLIVRVTPLAGADADADLEARGFARIDETIVMTLPLGAWRPDRVPSSDEPAMAAVPGARWLDEFARANGVAPANRGVHDRMMASLAPPAAFATLVAQGRAVAWGLAVGERGMAGLFDIVTAADARRLGAGYRLVTGLLAWARRQDAHTAYLQVVATNAPAIALYRRLGFAEAYRYHYRAAPQR